MSTKVVHLVELPVETVLDISQLFGLAIASYLKCENPKGFCFASYHSFQSGLANMCDSLYGKNEVWIVLVR